jgi:hypothetical protein
MPKKFQRHFTAPSFDIMDLDGVDKVVTGLFIAKLLFFERFFHNH